MKCQIRQDSNTSLVNLIRAISPQKLNIFYTVLVAHNGFQFDFPILFAEVERRQTLELSAFESSDIHFADTLHQLKKVANIKKY